MHAFNHQVCTQVRCVPINIKHLAISNVEYAECQLTGQGQGPQLLQHALDLADEQRLAHNVTDEARELKQIQDELVQGWLLPGMHLASCLSTQCWWIVRLLEMTTRLAFGSNCGLWIQVTRQT